ncbi:MAG: class I SAM-dependent methyltransferase [Candidatus Poribacteria bacterium]|nr:class I SAM-dependent methyltransferase [Candidatus Poribacteria bacterium]MDE0505898.1 class I SAM-dependent methyltransferase [Candidatus Poribacteria bacterium]
MDRVLEPEAMDSLEDAEAYDAMDHTNVNIEFVERVIELGAKRGRYLDVGTGPAAIPIMLAERLPSVEVTGIDLSASMLELGKSHIDEAGLTERITLRQADAKELPYPGGFFDGVICNSIIHHIPDPLPMLGEVSRVIRADGLILIRDLIRPESSETALNLVEKYADGATPYQRKLFYDSFLAAFTIAEIEEMLDQVNLPDTVVIQSSDRHWSIERPVEKS